MTRLFNINKKINVPIALLFGVVPLLVLIAIRRLFDLKRKKT